MFANQLIPVQCAGMFAQSVTFGNEYNEQYG